MIPLHTPPGTRIVCIDDEQHNRYSGRVPGALRNDGLGGLRLGAVYTLIAWAKDPFVDEPNVVIAEIHREEDFWGRTGFSPRRFRLAELPRCLTELAKSEPVDSNELV